MPEGPLGVAIVVGRIVHAQPFPETRKPDMMQLRIDLGDRIVASAAQYAHHYAPEDLVGRLVLCATGLGTRKIAGFTSEVLTCGIVDPDGHPVLVSPDRPVALGSPLQ